MIERLPKVPRREWLFVWGVVLAAIVASSIPYATQTARAIRSPAAYQAPIPFAPGDTNVYYSYIEQVRQGRILVENAFSTLPQTPRLLSPVWLVLGWMSALFRLSPPVVFHLARLAAIALFLSCAYRVLAAFFSSVPWRRIGLVVIAFSSGIGALIELFRGNSEIYHGSAAPLGSDLWISESNTFLTFMHSPLFILAQLALLGSLYWFLAEERIGKRWFAAGFILLALSFAHTYDLLIIGTVLAAFFFARILTLPFPSWRAATRYAARAAALGLFPLVGVLYLVWVVSTEPAIRGWVVQNVTLSPRPVSYLVGYGLLLPLAAVGGAVAIRRQHRLGLLFLVWIVVAAFLVYLPGLTIQRRLTNGIHLPLAVLAVYGAQALVAWCRVVLRPRVATVLLAVASPIVALGLFATPIAVVILLGDSVPVGPPYRLPYSSDDLIRAAAWLRANMRPDEGILAAMWESNVLAGATGHRVYLGHEHQTPDWPKVRDAYGAFVTGLLTQREEQEFLAANAIRYLVIEDGSATFADYQPRDRPFLVPAFRSGTVMVYRVEAGREMLPRESSPPSVSSTVERKSMDRQPSRPVCAFRLTSAMRTS